MTIIELIEKLKISPSTSNYKELTAEMITLSGDISKIKSHVNQYKFDYENLRNKRLLELKATVKVTLPELEAMLDGEFTMMRGQLLEAKNQLEEMQANYSAVLLFIDAVKTEIIIGSKQSTETFTI